MGFLRISALLALAVAACDSSPPTQATIRLSLNTDSGGCESADCESFRMSCGATVSLRLTDVDTGEVLRSQGGQPLSVCATAEIDETICSLRNLASEMVLEGMPAKTMRVEVAVWSGELSCDYVSSLDTTNLFDLFGRPNFDFRPDEIPAFAGATYFRAGEDDDVDVALSCSGSELLDARTCAANLPTDVAAEVMDMGRVQILRKEEAANVAVRVGQAREVPDGLGGSFFVLEQEDLSELDLDIDGPTPLYEGAIPLPFIDAGELVCSAVREDLAQATTNVFCEEIDPSREDLALSPLLLSKDILDAILDALGLESFPETGILIGRVVDEGFSPISGVAVTPSDAASVLYLNDDLSAASQGLSSNSAFFVSTDVTFGSSWTASAFDGRRHSGSPRGGLVQGKVSTLLIRMTGDVNQ